MNVFRTKINNCKVFRKHKFFNMRMNEDQTLAEHLSTFSSLIHQLEALRAHVYEDEKKAILVTSTQDISPLFRGLTSFACGMRSF